MDPPRSSAAAATDRVSASATLPEQRLTPPVASPAPAAAPSPDGCGAAQRTADLNGARVASCEFDAGDIVVFGGGIVPEEDLAPLARWYALPTVRGMSS